MYRYAFQFHSYHSRETLILSSASFAAPSPTKAQDEAGRLLKSVATDAQQIQSAASGLEKLAKNPIATWTAIRSAVE